MTRRGETSVQLAVAIFFSIPVAAGLLTAAGIVPPLFFWAIVQLYVILIVIGCLLFIPVLVRDMRRDGPW